MFVPGTSLCGGLVRSPTPSSARSSGQYSRRAMSAATVPTATDPAAQDPYAAIARAFDELAPSEERWARRTRGYHELVTAVHQSIVPPGASVLEIGSGAGDLLAALEPARRRRRRRQPGHGRARAGAPSRSSASRSAPARTPTLGETFDYVVLSDLLPYVDDLLALFQNVARHSHRETRIVVHSYSQLWRPALRVLELLRLKPRNAAPQLGRARRRREPPPARRARAGDARRAGSCSRCGSRSSRPSSTASSRTCWIIRHLCLTYWIVARPRPAAERREPQRLGRRAGEERGRDDRADRRRDARARHAAAS